MKKETISKKSKVPFKIAGAVIKGRLQGARLGFPTANIVVPEGAKSGIYAGRVKYLNVTYLAAIFIGADERILEAHLLDFTEQIYNKKIEVAVEKKIREVEDFPNYDDLIARIRKDIEEVRKFYHTKRV